MAQLAIKGHPTRGNEVIEILEMLGGINVRECDGTNSCLWYCINERNDITFFTHTFNLENYKFFALEEFLENFPYKVGDKVLYKYDNTTYFIRKMFWENDKILYELSDKVYSDGCSIPDTLIFNVDAVKLQPYKEETMEEKIESFEILESHCADEVKIEFDPSRFEMVERDNGYYVVKKKPQYPKTYEKCCKAVNASPYVALVYDKFDGKTYSYDIDNLQIYENIRKLKICRDAYWKIAGDWKPDFTNKEQKKFTISFIQDEIEFSGTYVRNSLLAFPTKEMRDAFYENFKDLIESCKELL